MDEAANIVLRCSTAHELPNKPMQLTAFGRR